MNPKNPHISPFPLPYGETFIEQGGYTYDNPYKFNGKELDEETRLYYYGARYYDPKVSLWLSVDRYAQKYPGISPYSYTAGNPINFVDIKGDSIWISFGKRNQYKALYMNGKLYNADGSIYKGPGVKITKRGKYKITNSFLRHTVKALNRIASAEAKLGTNVIETLQKSKFNYVIAHAKYNPQEIGRNLFVEDNVNNAYAIQLFMEGKSNIRTITDLGSGGTIYWNPSYTDTNNALYETEGIGIRPDSNLAHELWHAYDASKGQLYDTIIWGLKYSEWEATYFENRIRNVMGYPYRMSFGNVRILNSSNQPIRIYYIPVFSNIFE